MMINIIFSGGSLMSLGNKEKANLKSFAKSVSKLSQFPCTVIMQQKSVCYFHIV